MNPSQAGMRALSSSGSRGVYLGDESTCQGGTCGSAVDGGASAVSSTALSSTVSSMAPMCGGSGVTSGVPAPLMAAPSSIPRRALGAGDVSEGPSESSANVSLDTEDDGFNTSTIPHLERFYEQLAAKARLPERHGASSAWVLSLARSYRRLSKEKRRRGRLRALLQPGGVPGGVGGLPAAPGGGLQCPTMDHHQLGWSSNTDDSGYEAGYETDADESELSEWESGKNIRKGHKRKLDALVHLTMRLGLSGSGGAAGSGPPGFDGRRTPPLKSARGLESSSGTLGTQSVGSAMAWGPATGQAVGSRLCAPPPLPSSLRVRAPMLAPPEAVNSSVPAPSGSTGTSGTIAGLGGGGVGDGITAMRGGMSCSNGGCGVYGSGSRGLCDEGPVAMELEDEVSERAR